MIEIYDVWSFGEVDPAAIRRFMQHPAVTWPRSPEALILVGDGTSDPHKYLGRNNANHIPPYVDFGSVAAAPSEILKLVLVEFATVYGNDWFTLPWMRCRSARYARFRP